MKKIAYNILAFTAIVFMMSSTSILSMVLSFLATSYFLHKAEVVDIWNEALKEEDDYVDY